MNINILLRRLKIKTRLLYSFFIVVLLAFIVGFTGFISLTSIGNMAVRTMQNVRILNDIYDYSGTVNTGITAMVNIVDATLSHYVIQTTRVHTDEMLKEMDRYLKIQEHFKEVFSPGEMQEMATIFEVYRDTYIPVANEIFELVEHGHREDALYVAVNRLTPLYNSIMYTIKWAFLKNLEYSEMISAKNNDSARFSSILMISLVLLSLFASIVLALGVTRSIAVPLSNLGINAEKIANGELDVKIEDTKSNDEIAYLSLKLQDTLQQLHQAQHLKLEAINAKHEKEKAEASARSKSAFLAKMSHEIRTPMNAITGMAELALREDMPAAAHEHILTIKQASANLLSIINDILDFSKIDSGKLEIVPVEYLLSSLINDVINIIRTRVLDSHVRFIVNIDSNIPDALFGDEARIRQVLLNILSNAFKFTEKGFVSLAVNGTIQGDNVNLSIEIIDTGRGIKKEDIKKLFADFVQVDMSGNQVVEGTGLGLAISNGLLKAMDGNISVKSEYGEGSVFTVELPQKIRKFDKMAAVKDPQEKSVLVFEPRKIYADSIIRTLENLEVKCKLASTEEELCEDIARGRYSFAFIASNIYEKNKNSWANIFSSTKIVLLAGYYDIIADHKLHIVSMPAHAISVANILNGVTAIAHRAMSHRGEKKKNVSKFTAPYARILVVDDINTNLKVVEGLLLPYKIQVDLCQSGFDAIEAVKKKNYDIVFMDHMMPDMDGIETTTNIRNWELEINKERKKKRESLYKKNTIIALTANAVSGMREMFLEKGFDDFLAKPIDIAKLDEMLDHWIPKEKKEYGKDNYAPALSVSESEFPAIKGIDTGKGLAMTGGTEAGYRSVLSMYIRDAEERLPFLRHIPIAETLTIFITQVHAIKSASASIGATELSAQAAKLEAAGRAQDMEFIQKNLSNFVDNLKELSANIRSVIEKDKAGDSASQINLENIIPLLRKLETALGTQNFSEIDHLINELNSKQLDVKTKESIDKISDDILMTEYDNAMMAINEFLHDKT